MKAKGRLFWASLFILSVVAMGYLVYDMFPEQASQTEKRDPSLPLPPGEKPDYRRLLPRKARSADMVFIGKAVCSLKRSIALPVEGTFSSLNVQAGQAVKKGDVLASYRPAPQSRLRSTMASDIQALDLLVNGLIRQLTDLKNEFQRLKGKEGHPTSAGKRLKDIEKRVNVLNDQVKLLLSRIDDEGAGDGPERTAPDHHAGASGEPMRIPDDATVTSPMDGHVLWVHPEIRPGAQWTASDPVFVVGAMDPMLVRSHVYEEEAFRLALDDRVTLQPESLHPKKFQARISRISWTPLSLDPVQPSYYEVEFTAANPNLMLREGMRVIVRLHKPLKPPSQDTNE